MDLFVYVQQVNRLLINTTINYVDYKIIQINTTYHYN